MTFKLNPPPVYDHHYLEAIAKLAAEDLDATSDEEIRRAMIEDGLDPDKVAAEVRESIAGVVQNFRMAQSTKERQEALRARRLMLGMTEVRGIYLHPDQHAELKAEAKKLLKKQQAGERKRLPDSSDLC